MIPVIYLNSLAILLLVILLVYIFADNYPKKNPILTRQPYSGIKNRTKRIPIEVRVGLSFTIFTTVILFSDNIFAIDHIPPADEVQSYLLFLTAAGLLWYSWETFLQRKESQKQTYLAIKPFFTITPNIDGDFELRNLGSGPGINVKVELYGDNEKSKLLEEEHILGEIGQREVQKIEINSRTNFNVQDVLRVGIKCLDIANNSHEFEYTSQYYNDPITQELIGDVSPFVLSKLKMPVQFKEKSKTFSTHFLSVNSMTSNSEGSELKLSTSKQKKKDS